MQAGINAKESARGEQHNSNVNSSEKKTLIRVLAMPRSQRDDYHPLSWEQQVVLMRLRTRYNRMHRTLKLVFSPICLCGQEDKTTEHFFFFTKMSPSQKYKRRCVACQHSTDDQTLRLQAGAGEDHLIYPPIGLIV